MIKNDYMFIYLMISEANRNSINNQITLLSEILLFNPPKI